VMHAIEVLDLESNLTESADGPHYSHSIVPGGFDVTS
jgi:hypothetical protein